MTRSKIKREMREGERAMRALDHAVDYLDRSHHDHAAAIAMRTMYELALIWKIERDYRLVRDRDDPRLAFHISDRHVSRVHGMVAALTPPSELDAVAKHYVITLLAEFGPDRAWSISRNIYNAVASLPYPFITC
jgi:hypothetical protein